MNSDEDEDAVTQSVDVENHEDDDEDDEDDEGDHEDRGANARENKFAIASTTGNYVVSLPA